MLEEILSALRKEGWSIHQEKDKNKIYRCSYLVSKNLQNFEYFRSEKEIERYIEKIK